MCTLRTSILLSSDDAKQLTSLCHCSNINKIWQEVILHNKKKTIHSVYLISFSNWPHRKRDKIPGSVLQSPHNTYQPGNPICLIFNLCKKISKPWGRSRVPTDAMYHTNERAITCHSCHVAVSHSTDTRALFTAKILFSV